MSPALPVVSGQETISALAKIGFVQVGQRGSHVKLRNDEGRTVVVPLHRELARGTLSAILRQSGVTVNEFIPNSQVRVRHLPEKFHSSGRDK